MVMATLARSLRRHRRVAAFLVAPALLALVGGEHGSHTHPAHPDPAHTHPVHTHSVDAHSVHAPPEHTRQGHEQPAPGTRADGVWPASLSTDPPGIVSVDMERRTLTLEARAQPTDFEGALPPDHQYHALVHEGGSAAGKALFLTEAADTTVARLLREMGAEDGGGVPMSAWNLRWVPLVPQPAARVQGTPVRVEVHWVTEAGEAVTLPLGDLLRDPGGKGTSFRFGGNEDQNHHWDSGCILCLFSCPGGVISNAAYTIRDHQRGATHFLPSDRMPVDGTAVRIILALEPERESG